MECVGRALRRRRFGFYARKARFRVRTKYESAERGSSLTVREGSG
jgi:hypothetical protein